MTVSAAHFVSEFLISTSTVWTCAPHSLQNLLGMLIVSFSLLHIHPSFLIIPLQVLFGICFCGSLLGEDKCILEFHCVLRGVQG
jgi:hypothetical protein